MSKEINFFYENGVFINKLNIHDAEVLTAIEYNQAYKMELYLRTHPIAINGIAELSTIHKMLFGILYDWAGEFRQYELQKDTTFFVSPGRFPDAMTFINGLIAQILEDSGQANNKAHEYAELLDNLNYLHPFREGNGRAIRVFITLLASQQGYVLQYDRDNSEMIRGLIDSDINKIASLISLEEQANVRGTRANKFMKTIEDSKD